MWWDRISRYILLTFLSYKILFLWVAYADHMLLQWLVDWYCRSYLRETSKYWEVLLHIWSNNKRRTALKYSILYVMYMINLSKFILKENVNFSLLNLRIWLRSVSSFLQTPLFPKFLDCSASLHDSPLTLILQ